MSEHTVTADGILSDILVDLVRVQRWRVPLLVRHGGVTARRNRTRLSPLEQGTRLRRGDVITLLDPSPSAYTAALASLPANEFWDYAFIPATDSAADYARGFFTQRPRSRVIRGEGLPNTTLESFIEALEQGRDLDHPIRFPIAVSHANEQGQLFIAMNIVTAHAINYEDLELAERTHRIQLDSAALQPRPSEGGAVVAPQFWIRGCRIGQATAYLQKFRDALGGGIQVNAPKHFQQYGELRGTGSAPSGVYEYMAYDFTVFRTRQLRNSAAVVRAMTARAFTWVNGNPVPASTLAALVRARGMPPNVNTSGKHDLAWTVTFDLGSQRLPVPVGAEYRYEVEELFTGWSAFPLPSDPGTETARQAAVRAELERDATYQASHAYPMWVRFGYQSMAEFMAGWAWTFQYDHQQQQLRYRATRHIYTFVVPITVPGTTRLVMNFYPTAGSAPAVEMLRASDTAYYTTV